MTLAALKIQPGINREGTQSETEGMWYDSDLIRFRSGHPESIGGWIKYYSSTFRGAARAIFDYVTAAGTNYLLLGTQLKYYAGVGTTNYDITPLRVTTAAGDVTFAATTSSSVITVTDVAHGAVVNDFVTYSGAATLGDTITGTVLNAEHQITAINSVDEYTIDVTTTATASDTGNGGASVVGAYQINVGLNTFVSSTGWGLDEFGDNPYGSITAISTTNQLRTWSQDSYGNDIVFNLRGGAIYYFADPGGSTPFSRAVLLSSLGGASDVPAACLQVMMSDVDRHVIAFGSAPIGSSTIDPLFVRWSDQEAAPVWTPTSNNSAGGRRLSSGSFIIGGLKTRHEVLIWTDNGVHTMRFVGGDLVYEMSVVMPGVSMVGPRAAVLADGIVYFMDRGGFWIYNGGVVTLPCTLRYYVFTDINKNQSYKFYASKNADFNEVMFWYCSSSSNEIDRYVVFNYVENVWYKGGLARTVWIDAPNRSFPLAAASNGTGDNNYLYAHESGYDADGSAMTAYIESGDLDIEDGEHFTLINQVIADFALVGTTADCSIDIQIKGRRAPLDTLALLDTATVLETTEKNSVRARARQIVLRVTATASSYGWRLGKLRIDSRASGRG